MTETLLAWLNAANDFLWTYVAITLLVCCALYFTIRLGGVQFTHIGDMLRQLIPERNASPMISPFQAFSVALASRVGTGNLAGVASAIALGGPGAVFWMWIMALLGSATALVESTLAQLYKRKGEDSFYGGPAYYMEQGLHCRWMGVLFAILITLTFGLANQLVQSNTICDALSDTLAINKQYVGIALMLLTLVIIFGGVKRISRFAAVCVPFMAVGYIVIAIIVIVMNITTLPAVLKLIVTSALGMRQAAGGVLGMAILQGVKRGLFSNEAGEGSAPNAAAIATTSHPVKQGLLQSLGVFTDTLIICTCTAFIIIISGLYDDGSDGIILTTQALESEIGVIGRWFIMIAIFLFAYSTIIGNYFYGETNVRFIISRESKDKNDKTGKPATKDEKMSVLGFRILSGLVIMAGAFMTLQTAFTFVDLVMGLMTITNLIAIFLLFPRVKTLLNDYKRQRKEGKNPVFRKDIFPEEVQKDIECWE